MDIKKFERARELRSKIGVLESERKVWDGGNFFSKSFGLMGASQPNISNDALCRIQAIAIDDLNKQILALEVEFDSV